MPHALGNDPSSGDSWLKLQVTPVTTVFELAPSSFVRRSSKFHQPIAKECLHAVISHFRPGYHWKRRYTVTVGVHFSAHTGSPSDTMHNSWLTTLKVIVMIRIKIRSTSSSSALSLPDMSKRARKGSGSSGLCTSRPIQIGSASVSLNIEILSH